MISTRLEQDERRIIIIERDSSVAWAVAFIILALAIGFGIIIFMDQQTMVEYKIEQALDKMQERQTYTYRSTSFAPTTRALLGNNPSAGHSGLH